MEPLIQASEAGNILKIAANSVRNLMDRGVLPIALKTSNGERHMDRREVLKYGASSKLGVQLRAIDDAGALELAAVLEARSAADITKHLDLIQQIAAYAGDRGRGALGLVVVKAMRGPANSNFEDLQKHDVPPIRKVQESSNVKTRR